MARNSVPYIRFGMMARNSAPLLCLNNPLARNSVPDMPDYRRWYVPGATYFFTVVTWQRAPILIKSSARDYLREALHECRGRWPFENVAFVLLPDHLHTIWTLPRGDSNYSRRWA